MTYLLQQGANPLPYFETLTSSGGYCPEILETMLEFYGPEQMDIYDLILKRNLISKKRYSTLINCLESKFENCTMLSRPQIFKNDQKAYYGNIQVRETS